MKIPLLDHGYVEVVETWGSEERIIEAARMSTGKGFLGWGVESCRFCHYPKGEHVMGHDPIADRPRDFACVGFSSQFYTPHVATPGDEKLLKFLYDHKHATPFEMAGLVIEVQAPIFVFREWHRHRTQSYNEMSARYTPLPDVNYIPSIERVMINAGGSNRQAGTIAGSEPLDDAGAEQFRGELANAYHEAEALYQSALTDGIPKELARLCLPVGRYSRMRASANLRNWLGFLTLRMSPDAQWEIRQYANAVGSIIETEFPRTWRLFLTSQGT